MIICAALNISQPGEDLMICGYRHSDCYETLYRLDPELSKHARKFSLITEGFMATENRFLDRAEAYQEAINCGQLSAANRAYKTERNENTLFSEDLY